MCTKPTLGQILAFFIQAHSPECALARTTQPNELTRTPPNDPPERFYMGARTTKTKGQGRAGKTSCTNVHKANLRSQLSIFDRGSFARAHPCPNELTWTPLNDLPEQFYMGTCTTEMKPQGRAEQTSYMNVHKANRGSQLSIFDTGSFAPARPHLNNPPERVDTDTLKRPDRKILHGHPHDRNKATRESRANELYECAISQPRVTT